MISALKDDVEKEASYIRSIDSITLPDRHMIRPKFSSNNALCSTNWNLLFETDCSVNYTTQ